MKYVGVDLHKKTISICAVVLEGRKRKVLVRKRFACQDVDGIYRFFQELGAFQVVVEATASYEWFAGLLERLADRVVLAHPKKLRIIAQSKCKTDKIDAWVLAEFLALDMIPEAYRPTPRQREYRTLVRYRYYVQKRTVSVRNKMRHILANYNADVEELFTARGLAYLEELKVSVADRFVLNLLLEEWQEHRRRLEETNKQLEAFAKTAPLAEKEARQVLATFPLAGPVTIDVVLSEIGDVKRIRSLKRAASFAGLAPGFRESAGRRKEQGITKEGPRLLRWAMIQLAWRVVGRTAYWNHIFTKLEHRVGRKKAIVAVARRVFCVIVSMLRSGQEYRTSGRQAAAGFQRDDKGVRGEQTDKKPARKEPASPRSAAARKQTADGETALGFRRNGKGVRGEKVDSRPARKKPASPRSAAARKQTADGEAEPRAVKQQKKPQTPQRRPRRAAPSAHP
jgi:transposase